MMQLIWHFFVPMQAFENDSSDSNESDTSSHVSCDTGKPLNPFTPGRAIWPNDKHRKR